MDAGEELSVRYLPVDSLADGTKIFVAEGDVPEGIPVELRIDSEGQTTAVYADGSTEDDGPAPAAPGEA
ncbi:MAG TPA: hypothetical protein VK988_04945 [Acidimicrobiales bacterium]|nr:hypothetical protein [Acidimicrobiales bacterium]